MHTFHMGVGRDLVGSALKIMASSRRWFNGRNVLLRLKQMYSDVRRFAKLRGKHLSIKRLTKVSLGWGNQCPEFRGSAADTGAFLSWVVDALQQKPPCEPYEGLLGATWCADRLCSSLQSAEVFLSPEEQYQTKVLSKLFLESYCRLAAEAHDRGVLLWRLRPKLHYMQHLLESCLQGSGRNPTHDSCWLDEDYVRFAMKMYRKMSHRTASCNILRRNLVVLKENLKMYVRPV